MTAKDLIQELKKCDPNAQVRVGTCCGTVDGVIKGISGNVRSPSNKQHCVYVACEITHCNGEKVRLVRPAENQYSQRC